MFCRSLFVLLYFFFWPLCCLFFFDIQILITTLVSSNSSCRSPTIFEQNQKKLNHSLHQTYTSSFMWLNRYSARTTISLLTVSHYFILFFLLKSQKIYLVRQQVKWPILLFGRPCILYSKEIASLF